MLHLAGHYRLRFQSFSFNYQWVQVKRHKAILKQLAIICSHIADENPQVPYGFDPTGVTIDPATGKVFVPSSGKGLTCASFIMAIFGSQGLPLLKEREWSSTANAAWQQAMFEQLKADPRVDPNHLAAMINDVGQVRRFSPEEVAGSSHEAAWPVGFKRAQAAAYKITNKLRQWSPNVII